MANGYPNQKRLNIFTAKAMQGILANPKCYEMTAAEIAAYATKVAIATTGAVDAAFNSLVSTYELAEAEATKAQDAKLEAEAAAALDAKANAEVDATEAPAS